MARPVLMPLQVPAHRGAVAYDLLAQREIPLKKGPGGRGQGSGEINELTLDMRRMQGALVAFLPEAGGKLSVRHAGGGGAGSGRIEAALVGESGKELDAVFPVRVTLLGGAAPREFYRVLGRGLSFELDLPHTAPARAHRIEVREAISGRTAAFEVAGAAPAG